MLLRGFFIHRFQDGATATMSAAYDPETRLLTQEPDATGAEMLTLIPVGPDDEEVTLWHRAINEHFVAEAIILSEARARALYPDVEVKGSALEVKVRSLTDEMRSWDDPLLRDPNGPFRITELAAAQLGIEPTQ